MGYGTLLKCICNIRRQNRDSRSFDTILKQKGKRKADGKEMFPIEGTLTVHQNTAALWSRVLKMNMVLKPRSGHVSVIDDVLLECMNQDLHQTSQNLSTIEEKKGDALCLVELQ